MKDIVLDIATEFTDEPGSRYIQLGPNSGEKFYDSLLLPKFKDAKKNNVKLIIKLDDVWGYPSSFISGSFGKLSKEYGAEEVLKIIRLDGSDELHKLKITFVIEHPNERALAY
jgi:hypothetical protein